MSEQFIQQVEKNRTEVENLIRPFFPVSIGFPDTVIHAMIYSLDAPGKRLRPMLMRETYRLFGGKGTVVEPFMAAIEMIHTYSLIHDDLPAMDNDEFRRGRKTTHIVYGEDMAILAGDGLLNFAYETAIKAFDFGTDPVVIARAMKVLADKAGMNGMVGGQVVDVESEGKNLSEEVLIYIYEKKTAALLEAAMVIGAILAGATKNEQKVIQQVARKVGMAFQIQDDLLDIYSTTEELGKPVGSDERNQKYTYVSLLGVEKAREVQGLWVQEAIELMESLVVRNDYLKELLFSLVQRRK